MKLRITFGLFPTLTPLSWKKWGKLYMDSQFDQVKVSLMQEETAIKI